MHASGDDFEQAWHLVEGVHDMRVGHSLELDPSVTIGCDPTIRR
ncbi:MAG: hypothetical protein WEA75_06175 [Acidimicrobiia bacterium]